MRLLPILPALLLLGSSGVLRADAIPYGNIGTVVPATPLMAAATGNVIGYFYGASAGGSDYVRLLDVTSGYASLFLLDNQTSTPGESVDFGAVTAGDRLVFELVNSDVETSDGYTDFTNLGPIDPNARVNKYLLASDPAYSVDGLDHAYATAFSGDAARGISAGTYLSMEDLPAPYADFDYNDTQFVFTDVAATAVTPEPETWVLLGTGMLAMAGVRRRRGRVPLRSLRELFPFS